MADMQRIMVFDRLDQYLMDLDPRKILGAQVTLEINGEHSLTITTLQELEKTNRVVLRDNLGTWHEFVVAGLDEEHSQGGGAIARTYYCVWSLEYDTSGTYINDQFGCGVVPGHPSVPQPARRGLECALEGTARWQIGTITVTQQGSASFYRMSGWEGLKKVVERWGGELQATITVSTTGVVERHVDLLQHVGASAEEATRRFDYGSDLTKIKRTVHDEVWPCRVVPLGRSQETEAGGYTRRPGIASVNGGVDWLIDDEVADLVKVPDGSGGWEYPCAIIKNDQFEEPADIKAWALAHISEYTRPRVTYTAEVAQFAEAGLSAHEVELGDRVAVVDRTFMEGGLRIAVRVVKMKQDLLDPSGTTLIIGNAQQTLAGQLDALAGDISSVYDQSASASDWQNGSAYMDALIGRLNEEINQAGGYWYMVPGLGTRTYDVPVSDPAVGEEADAVVEISGGNIRIASSKTAGNWNWRTLIQSGLVVADTVKALDVNAGIIQSFDGSCYWDLDNSVFRFDYELDPISVDSSITVSSMLVVGASGVPITKGARYLVAFSTTHTPTSNLRIAFHTSQTSGSSSQYHSDYAPPTLTYVDGTTRRYAAIVTASSSVTSRVAFTYRYTQRYDETGSYTVTDVRVYAFPYEGSGVLEFVASDTGSDDNLQTIVRAGTVQVRENTVSSVFGPGSLSLSDAVQRTFIEMSPNHLIEFQPEKNAIKLGDTGSPTAPTFSLDGSTTPNILPGKLEKTGAAYIESNVVSDVLSGVNLVTFTSVHAFRWGPIAALTATCTLPATSASTSGRAYRQIATLKPAWAMEPGGFFIGIGTIGSIAKHAMFFANSSGQIYMADDPSYTAAITASTSVTFDALYLLSI